jgi:TolB-like protein
VALTLAPIRTLGNDAVLSAAAGGLTEELAARLGQLPGVRFAAGVNGADSGSATVPVAAQETALRVDGSLRRERERVRASVRIVAVRADSTAWSGAFEGTVDSLFAFQARVAEATFTAMRAVRGGSPEP